MKSKPILKGFTLIELLIVVAIIAILAAIAVPNFLEAQTRAKVSRAKSDIRSVVTAIEAYRVDQNNYPISHVRTAAQLPPGAVLGLNTFTINPRALRLRPVTTPVAYITSVPSDPFNTEEAQGALTRADKRIYIYLQKESYASSVPNAIISGSSFNDGNFYRELWGAQLPSSHYMLESVGPAGLPDSGTDGRIDLEFAYDPTNGTVSQGYIMYVGSGYGFADGD